LRYKDFENIITPVRMGRYLVACGNRTQKAMTLYRKNLKLSQELFTVISCFEITLRNVIDNHYHGLFGNDWLRNAASPGGRFDNAKCRVTKLTINDAISKLGVNYTHHKMVAELGFGFWRFMFAQNQYKACGNTLLQVFPNKPRSTPSMQYNQGYVFDQLKEINKIRNRIAHHEPICFSPRTPIKDTTYAREHYNIVIQLFQWLNIDETSLLYGLDHIMKVCNEIDNI